MKKERKWRMAFEELRKSYPQIRQQAAASGARNLFHYETVIRNHIQRLRKIPDGLTPEYRTVYDGYTALLDDVSRRLLEQYNQKHHTMYRFESVVDGHREDYLSSGIIAVLMTSHIPQMVTAEFHRLLPEHPQEEYPEARRMKRKFYLHLGDTNTGKTYQALKRLKQAGSGIYLAPLRILALENFERLGGEGVPCSLLTGEEAVSVPGAKLLCCTVEKANLGYDYDVAVIDEVQLLADSQRGDAWTGAILGLRCPEIHLCGAELARDQLITIIRDCGDDYELKEYRRLVPLQLEREPVSLQDVGPGDALVAFSKRNVLSLSTYFTRMGVANSVIYGDLPPEVRRSQYESFIRGENPVLIATDAIGMGVNLPIRRLIFTEVEKFDGELRRPLTTQEVKQIAGRAGRIGIYDVGYVATLGVGIDLIEDRLLSEDEPIEQAVIGPSEAILQIGLLPLPEKLALWSTQPESLPYYRKKDVRNELLILDLLRPYHLPEQVQWRLMHVPFDPGNSALLAQFSEYAAECFTLRAATLGKPESSCGTCQEYETYYQQVNLYYSFSKAMELPLDEQWVTNMRARISRNIRRLLQTRQHPPIR
ncbi:MAG: helicase-related protein [Oscillospiraceae bacterium]|nr:helicase-related protein [Oscillospiraceae bacterium]